MFQKSILHLDLDNFFVAVERLHNSQLKGKPVIIGGTSRRGVVSSCSYEARHFGVHSAMPMSMALRLCPDAIVVRGDYDNYTKQSQIVTEIVQADAPIFEKASIDEFYVDLTGMDKHVGCFKWSKELRTRIIKESGLPISCGLSVNKTVSKVGTNESKPDGFRLINPGTEKAFLAPLSIKKMPSVGKVTYQKLSFMGVRTIKVLSEIPPPLLQREFGKHGLSLWKKANGIDNSIVEPYSERKSLSAERTFQTDTIDVRFLRNKLTQMVMNLAFELRQKQKLTSVITIKIRYSDFNTYTRQKRIAYTAHDQVLIDYAHSIFKTLYNRRQAVRLIGVKFSDLVHGNYQINLFENTAEEANLLNAMDKIRQRFGATAIKRAL